MRDRAAGAQVEGHFTIEDQQPRNSCHQICYVFMARAASGCRWNETSAGDEDDDDDDDDDDEKVKPVKIVVSRLSSVV